MSIVRNLTLAGMALALAAAPAAAQTKWDMSLPWGPNEYHTKNAQTFAEKVKEVTNGQVQITVHPAGALGIKGPETLRSVRDGIVPIAEFALLTGVGEEPVLGFESLPYLMGSIDDFRKFREINRAEFVKAIEKHNQKVLYMAPWPPNQIYTKKQVRSLEDLKGMKMRAVDRNTTELARRLGMVPVQLAIGDVIPALASGALEGHMTSMGTAAGQKVWEFTKYAYLTNHIWASNAMVVNRDAWNKLTPAQQAAIDKAAKDLEPGFWDIAAGDDAIRLKQLREAGMTVEAPPADVAKAMQDAAKPMWEEFAKTVGGPVPENLKTYLARTGR